MELRDVVSLSDLAARFARAKGMDEAGFQWLRSTPGPKGKRKEGSVGNGLAVLKALRSFNRKNPQPIAVYRVTGYDGLNKRTLTIAKADVIRLKGYILRGAAERPGRRKRAAAFRVLEEVAV